MKTTYSNQDEFNYLIPKDEKEECSLCGNLFFADEILIIERKLFCDTCYNETQPLFGSEDQRFSDQSEN